MFNSLTHHAYAVAGRAADTISELFAALETTGFKIRGNPDFRSESFDVFGVDEARALKEAAGRKAVSGGKKVFIVSARGITKEAQNALLKILEEPPADTHFFLAVPSLDIFLPTLRSRLLILHAKQGSGGAPSPRADAFLASTIPARLKTVQALLKNAEEEAGKADLVAFLDEIEDSLVRRLACAPIGRSRASRDRAMAAGALQTVLQVKKYSRDRAPSFKLLLEHVALVLPRFQALGTRL